MVKVGQGAGIEEVTFDPTRALGVEVLGLRALRRRVGSSRLERPHRADFHHLLLFAGRPGSHAVDLVRHRVRPGQVLHVAPAQVHAFGPEPGLDAALVVFRGEVLRELPPLPARPVALPPRRAALVRALVRGLDDEVAAARSPALVRALLAALVQAADVGPPPAPGADLARRFAAAVEQHHRRTREVAAYAAVLRCTPRTLNRHARRWTGRTAKQVVDDRVVLEARRLLAAGTQAVAEVAAALGFAEPTQFGKFFRDRTGETPGAFRARFAAAGVPLPGPGAPPRQGGSRSRARAGRGRSPAPAPDPAGPPAPRRRRPRRAGDLPRRGPSPRTVSRRR